MLGVELVVEETFPFLEAISFFKTVICGVCTDDAVSLRGESSSDFSLVIIGLVSVLLSFKAGFEGDVEAVVSLAMADEPLD